MRIHSVLGGDLYMILTSVLSLTGVYILYLVCMHE